MKKITITNISAISADHPDGILALLAGARPNDKALKKLVATFRAVSDHFEDGRPNRTDEIEAAKVEEMAAKNTLDKAPKREAVKIADEKSDEKDGEAAREQSEKAERDHQKARDHADRAEQARREFEDREARELNAHGEKLFGNGLTIEFEPLDGAAYTFSSERAWNILAMHGVV